MFGTIIYFFKNIFRLNSDHRDEEIIARDREVEKELRRNRAKERARALAEQKLERKEGKILKKGDSLSKVMLETVTELRSEAAELLKERQVAGEDIGLRKRIVEHINELKKLNQKLLKRMEGLWKLIGKEEIVEKRQVQSMHDFGALRAELEHLLKEEEIDVPAMGGADKAEVQELESEKKNDDKLEMLEKAKIKFQQQEKERIGPILEGIRAIEHDLEANSVRDLDVTLKLLGHYGDALAELEHVIEDIESHIRDEMKQTKNEAQVLEVDFRKRTDGRGRSQTAVRVLQEREEEEREAA